VIISPWRKVRELHDSFKHSQSGLGVAAQLIIAILMSAVVGPMAMGAMGGAATSAAATSLATTGAISTINNKGNLGAVARDVTSKDAIKGYAISGITVGLTSGQYDGWTGTETASHTATRTANTGALTNSATVATTEGLSTWSGIGQFAANQALQQVGGITPRLSPLFKSTTECIGRSRRWPACEADVYQFVPAAMQDTTSEALEYFALGALCKAG